MPAVVLDLDEVSSWLDKRLGPSATKEVVKKGLYSAALKMVQVVQTKVIPQIHPTPVARGVYRAGWKAWRLPKGAAFGNTVPWAGAVEHGLRGKDIKVGRAMLASLTDWVRLKGISTTNARRTAFAIAVKMASEVRVRSGKSILLPTKEGGRKRGQLIRIIVGGNKGMKPRGVMAKATEFLPAVIREEVAAALQAAIHA